MNTIKKAFGLIVLVLMMTLSSCGSGVSEPGKLPESVKLHALPYRFGCTNKKLEDTNKLCNYDNLWHAANLWNAQTGLNLIEIVPESEDVDVIFVLWEDGADPTLEEGFDPDVITLPLQYGGAQGNVALLAKFLGFGLGLSLSEDPESVMYGSASLGLAGQTEFELPKLKDREISFVNNNLVP